MGFDFTEYIEDNFDPKHQMTNPDQVSINCINPDCDDNWRQNRKMTVNLRNKIAFCFKCGEKYDEISFVAQVEGISRFRALQRVRSNDPPRTYGPERLEAALKKLTPEPTATEGPATAKKEACKFPPVKKIEPGSPAWNYLEGRRINQETIEHFGLGYTPYGPPNGTLCPTCSYRAAGRRCCPYAKRIIIPIYKDGIAVAFQARTIADAKPKYLFPLDQPFDSELYNWDHARTYGTIYVTEGVTSAWRVREFGYHNVTATFGKSLKIQQEKAIKAESRIKRVVMVWDGGTLPEAYAAGMRLYPHKEVLIARLPGKLDPDECPDTPHYIEHAIPIQNLDRLTVALSKIS